ncbi:MAG: PD40 domain-containing protein [Bryobacterales bacterium]|nr:PD40 domain-containing protein [Bryobacterales bacterium]
MDDDILCFEFDTVSVHPRSFTVERGGARLDLEPKAIRVLLHLLRNRHRAVSKDELVQAVWEGAAVTDNAITRVIAQLRRELGDDSRSPRFVETLPTVGYRFIAPVREVRTPAAVPAAAPPPPRSRLPLVAAAAAATAVLAPAAWWLATGAAPPTIAPRPADPVQITTTAGVDARPSFGPDGRAFVYCSNRSGRFELYRRDHASPGATVQLTDDGQQNLHPAWSPDGRWIAYHSAARRGIWVIPAAGAPTPPRRLSEFGSAPAWSPGSDTVAFTSAEPFSLAPFDTGSPGAIWTVTLNGSSLRQWTNGSNPRGSHAAPAWSRDGRRLAFAVLGRDSSIHLLDLASGQASPLVRTGVDIPRLPGNFVSRVWDPVFGPRDETLYFSAAGERGEHAIWAVPTQGGSSGKPVRVFTSQSDIPTGLTLSASGERLLFARLRNTSQLWTLDSATGVSKPLFKEEVLRAYVPSYSPDGQWLAFAVETQGRNRDIWVMPAAGNGEAVSVSPDPGAKEAGTVWTPAGELLYNYGNSTAVEFRAYHPATRKSRTILTRNVTGIFHPTLMPNTQDLLSACSTPMNICLGPANTAAAPRQLTFDRERAWFAIADRAGAWLAYQLTRGEASHLAVIRRDGTEPKLLTTDAAQNWAHSFSSDSRRIAFASVRDGVWNLWWIDRVTGERRQLTQGAAFGSFVRSPAWRPGTQQLAYEWFESRGNLFELPLQP